MVPLKALSVQGGTHEKCSEGHSGAVALPLAGPRQPHQDSGTGL